MPTSSPQPARRARSLRARGLTQRAIADTLGVSRTTVARWLSPAYAERDRRRSREAKRRRRAPCERCAQLLSYDRDDGICRACRRRDAADRHERVTHLYRDGASAPQIARLVGLAPGYVRTLLGELAHAGAVQPRFAYRDRASVRARERRVLALQARGYPRREIARAVGLAPGSLATVLARLRE